jgi:hypothetical protein
MTFKFKLDRKGGSEVLKSLSPTKFTLSARRSAPQPVRVPRSTTTPPTVQVLQWESPRLCKPRMGI